MKVAVVGHVEWCRFVKVDHDPVAGEIIRTENAWYEAAGGGGVAAVQLVQMAGTCLFFTAVGNDEAGRLAVEQLTSLGVEVYASISATEPTKQAFIDIDKNKERTITVTGNLEPSRDDTSLPWAKLGEMDAVYFVSGDAGALQEARQAKKLVSTSRVLPILNESALTLDALVMSSNDSNELYESGDLNSEPLLLVKTDGKQGGTLGTGEHYNAEVVDKANLQDSYGCGDSFAAGLTYGLGQDLPIPEVLKIATHRGAMAAQRSGAHGLRP
jgi:ribokinase